MSDSILLIGAILLDTKGKPTAGLEPETSNPGGIRSVRGGTARNVAENLARLGVETRLLSAVGDDVTGERLLAQTAASGVDVSLVSTIPDVNTGGYIAILETDGKLSVAMDDTRVLEQHMTSALLEAHEAQFREASMVMVDGSLTAEALETAVSLAKQHRVPLVADPSSTRLAHKLRPHLPNLHLVVPNEIEAAELCQCNFDGFDPDASLDTARRLVYRGVDLVVVTLSDFGLVYATPSETGYIEANFNEVVDSTGTGDAITAAIMFGLAHELPAVESMRLGAAAAGLTLQTSDTVVPDLSLDMLYENF